MDSTTDLLDRIAPKIDFDGPDGCWVWLGNISVEGYGRLGRQKAHRLVYEVVVEPVTTPAMDHLCRNRACVNPDHLEPVTHQVNILRGVSVVAQHAQQTHCANGHEFTPENTYFENRKYGPIRRCRECRRPGQRKHNQDYANRNRERRREYWRAYNQKRRG